MEDTLKSQVIFGTIGKVARILLALAVALALLSLIIYNSQKSREEEVWREEMTIGDVNAKNYYIQYTDLACPYCNMFSYQIMENYDEFLSEYIEGEEIFYEIRLTAFLYEYGEHQPDQSKWGAEAAYCAADEGKFMEYYHAALKTLWDDYYSKGIGISKTAEEITGAGKERSYWYDIGEGIGLGQEFYDCYYNEEKWDEVLANTERAAKLVESGVPYFQFGDFSTSGFDSSWGWEYVEQYLRAGL